MLINNILKAYESDTCAKLMYIMCIAVTLMVNALYIIIHFNGITDIMKCKIIHIR